jgi:hypothetical protein
VEEKESNEMEMGKKEETKNQKENEKKSWRPLKPPTKV